MPITRPTVTTTETGSRDGSSPVEVVGVDESNAVRKFRCPWASRFSLAQKYIGTVRIDYDGSIPPAPIRLERLTPLPHPDTDVSWFATKVESISGYKPLIKRTTSEDGSSNTFEQADVSIRYQPLPYAVIDDASVAAGDEYKRYTSFSDWQQSTDVLLLQSGSMHYVKADDTVIGVVPYNKPLHQPVLNFRCTWHRLPEDLLDWETPGPWLKRILGEVASGTPTRMNTVNQTAIWGFDPGTLAVLNWEPERRSMPFGSFEYDIHFQFQWRPQGFNRLWYNDLGSSSLSGYYYVARGNPATYSAPGSVPDGESLFNETEFRELFDVRDI